MGARPPHEQLRESLVARGLPEGQASRVAREICDHIMDLRDEAQRDGIPPEAVQDFVDRRLGPLDPIADAVVSEYRGRSFCGRHPVLCFLVAPLPLVTVAWAAIHVATLAVVGLLRDARATVASADPNAIVQFADYGSQSIAFAGIASMLLWSFRHSGHPARWLSVAWLQLVVFAALFHTQSSGSWPAGPAAVVVALRPGSSPHLLIALALAVLALCLRALPRFPVRRISS
jgi:hypothetical protein